MHISNLRVYEDVLDVGIVFNTLGYAKQRYTIDTLVQQINVGLRLYLWSFVTMKC